MARGVKQYKAFTLLELLVAMTLMVVTAACLYTALYTGFRAKLSAQSAVEPTSLAINAIELIKAGYAWHSAGDRNVSGGFSRRERARHKRYGHG